MIENLRSSLKEMISDLDWMGQSTKARANDKVIDIILLSPGEKNI